MPIQNEFGSMSQPGKCTIKIFMGGGAGMVDGGVTVKDAGSGVVGVGIIKVYFQKHLEIRWVKAKVIHTGGGSQPLPPCSKTLIIH